MAASSEDLGCRDEGAAADEMPVAGAAADAGSASEPGAGVGADFAAASGAASSDRRPGGPVAPSPAHKVAGAVEMAAGAAIAAAGIPMMVLPGPGAAALLGGAALASKGQRRYSGREASRVEEKLDAASAKAVEVAKVEGARAAKAVVRNAPKVAAATAKVAVGGAKLAGKGVVVAVKLGGKAVGRGCELAWDAYRRRQGGR